mgnify:CR=1 FL=1
MDNEYLIIKESKVHNKGAFARKFIPKGTRVIQYIGRIISKEESDQILHESYQNHLKDSNHAIPYLFELDNKHDLDGNITENVAKFINHSCNPNLEVEIKGHEVFLDAIRDINQGEELNYNYGFDLDDDTFKNHCYCNSHNCMNYICNENDWDKLKEKLNNKIS